MKIIWKKKKALNVHEETGVGNTARFSIANNRRLILKNKKQEEGVPRAGKSAKDMDKDVASPAVNAA
jgi:hypothetical protein